MQRPDQAKRQLILDTATRLFASRPFHEVRLDDIAAEASLGKGTLYVYFSSKEDIYLELIRAGFAAMVHHVDLETAESSESAWQQITSIIRGLISFGTMYPDLYRVMRSGGLTPEDPQLLQTRARLTSLIESALRRGIKSGEMKDPHPELTAQFIPAFVRGALLFPPANLTPSRLEKHILRVLRSGINAEAEA